MNENAKGKAPAIPPAIPQAPAAPQAPIVPTEPSPAEVAFTMDNWKEMLPQDAREWDAVKNAKTPKDLMDTFGYYQTRAGRSINIPGENATESDRMEFLTKLRSHVPELLDMPQMDDIDGMDDLYVKLGKPEDVTGYQTPEFEMVDGVQVDANQVDAFKQLALKHNLSKSQYNGLVKDFLGQSIEVSNAAQTKFNTELTGLSEEWGQAYDVKVSKAQKVAEQFFPNTDLGKLIADGAVGAGTLRDLEALASQLGTEGQQMVGQQGGTGINTPQELRDQAGELMARILDTPPGDTRNALIQKRLKMLQSAIG